MKKNLFLITAIVISVVVFACVSNNNDGEKHKRKAVFEQVGVQHNQGLDAILDELMRERIRLFEELANQPSTRSFSGHGFPETYNFDALIRREAKRLTKNWYPEVDDEFLDAVMPKQNFDVRTRMSSVDSQSEITVMLTPFQQEYHNRLLKLLDRKGQSVKRFVSDVVALENEIVEKAPTTEEAEQMLFTTSVARNSAEYWEKNMRKWAGMLNGEIVSIQHVDGMATRNGQSEDQPLPDGYYPNPADPTTYFWVSNGEVVKLKCPEGLYFNPEFCICDWPQNVFDWEEVAKGDVNGALVGAVGGAAAGAMAGGAVLPGAGRGAIAGGLTASATAALDELWDYLFN